MSSIPLPALSIQPPPDPTQGIARMAALKGMLQQQQQAAAMAPLQQQAAQQANQQREQQIKDQQAMTEAYRQWDGKDPKALPDLVIKNGGSANARLGIEKGMLAMQEQYSTIAKNDAETGSKNIETLKQKNDLILGALDTTKSVPDAQLGPHLANTIQSLTQQGLLDPQHGQAASALVTGLQNGQIDPKTARQQLDLFEKGISGRQALIDQAAKEAQTAQATAQAQKTQLEADALKKMGSGGIVPGVPLENQEAAAWMAKNPGKTLADYQKYKATLVPAFNFNLQASGVGNSKAPAGANGQPLQGEDLYKTFGGKAGVVKAIVEGRQSPPASFAQKSPYWQDIMQKVYQVDPQFNEQRAQVRKAFTVGKDAQNIRSLNTAAVHLDTFADAATAMGNGSFTPGNAIFNKARTMFGGATPTNFEGLRSAVAGEMANALKGSATDQEISSIKNTVMSQNSPQQLAGWINTNLHIIGQKLNTYKEAYDQQNPGDTVYSPVLPSAQAVFQKHGTMQAGGNTGGVSVKAPNGKTYHFSSQSAADSFKKEAGIP